MSAKKAAKVANVLYRFTPPSEGEFYPGLPDRDLTEDDVADTDPAVLLRALRDGWYVGVPRESAGTGEPMEGIEVRGPGGDQDLLETAEIVVGFDPSLLEAPAIMSSEGDAAATMEAEPSQEPQG